MSCNLYLYAKKDNQISILSDFTYELPFCFMFLISAHTRLIDAKECIYQGKSNQAAIGALEGDFDQGYKGLLEFLSKCSSLGLFEDSTYDSLLKKTTDALDSFSNTGTKVYLEIISDGNDDEVDMCAGIQEEVANLISASNTFLNNATNPDEFDMSNSDILNAIGVHLIKQAQSYTNMNCLDKKNRQLSKTKLSVVKTYLPNSYCFPKDEKTRLELIGGLD